MNTKATRMNLAAISHPHVTRSCDISEFMQRSILRIYYHKGFHPGSDLTDVFFQHNWIRRPPAQVKPVEVKVYFVDIGGPHSAVVQYRGNPWSG